MSLIDKDVDNRSEEHVRKPRIQYIYIGITGLAIVIMAYSIVIALRANNKEEELLASLKTNIAANETLTNNNKLLKRQYENQSAELEYERSIKPSTEIIVEDEVRVESPKDENENGIELSYYGVSEEIIIYGLKMHVIEEPPTLLAQDNIVQTIEITDIKVIDESMVHCNFSAFSTDGKLVLSAALYKFEIKNTEIVYSLVDEYYKVFPDEDLTDNISFGSGAITTIEVDKETHEVYDIDTYSMLANEEVIFKDQERVINWNIYTEDDYYIYDNTTGETILMENISIVNPDAPWNREHTKTIVNNSTILDVYTLDSIEIALDPKNAEFIEMGENLGMIRYVSELERYVLTVFDWEGERLDEYNLLESQEYVRIPISVMALDNNLITYSVTTDELAFTISQLNMNTDDITEIGTVEELLPIGWFKSGYYLCKEYASEDMEPITGISIINQEGKHIAQLKWDAYNERLLNVDEKENLLYFDDQQLFDDELESEDEHVISYYSYDYKEDVTNTLEIPLDSRITDNTFSGVIAIDNDTIKIVAIHMDYDEQNQEELHLENE